MNDLPQQSDQPEAPPPSGPAGKPGSEQASVAARDIPEWLPILPVRNALFFPGSISPLTVGRPESLQLLEENLQNSKYLGLVLQRDAEIETPAPDDLYDVGVLVKVLKLLRPEENPAIVLTQVERRLRLTEFSQTKSYLKAKVELLEDRLPDADDEIWLATVRNLRDSSTRLIDLLEGIPPEAGMAVQGIDDPAVLTDFLANNLSIEVIEKQKLLEETDVAQRVASVQEHIDNQLRIAELQQKLRADVQSEFTDAQKRAYLREQLRAIQKELGIEGSTEEQAEDLRKRLKESGLPEAAMEQAERELKRLEIIPPASPDHSVIISYLESLAELPWNKLSQDNLDLDKAQTILDRDHYGLKKVKKRLIEYLAVRKLNPTGHGPILCFVGPPGVGKTSVGQSIADALGRKFARISLGGIRDEAEIRGHRRTYIGSMPGRIIQELRRAGTRNPVFMLDEVDKIGMDFRGDPASALLEVLDPAQNQSFSDRYLDVPFDLSQVMFIATCNTLDTIPTALRDRMEVIELPGYTEEEKLHIANGYLVTRQLKENGLDAEQCRWSDDAIRTVIEDYTREAGVRNLERRIGAVCRNIASQIAKGETAATEISPEKVREVLGPAEFIREEKLKTSRPGVVTGLAYTAAGGDTLHIEAISYPGKGNIILTGQLGDVMQESVRAAYSLVRSKAEQLDIEPGRFEETDVHVHVPAGAVPKDGPSAGIAMFAALVSLYTNRPVNKDVAMTGEITLRGLVLPIGGLKEKTIAALRSGVKTVLVPKLNEKDLPELPEEVKERLTIIPVETVDEVLKYALEKD